MKKITILLVGAFIVLTLSIGVLTGNQASAEGKSDYAKGEILVKFKETVSPNEANEVHKRLGGRVEETIPGINVQVVSVNRGIGEAVSAYARNRQVAYAEPNYIAHALESPNDFHFDKQWGMHNTGLDGGSEDADIDAPEAWDLTQGNPDIVIAILDTGIDQNHEDLEAKLGLQENFTDSDTLDDRYGHGTHVAGIAAAITNNNVGVAGVGYQASLMNVKVLGDNASGYYSWIASGMIWAADKGADVINMSLGAGRKSITLEDAVNYAWDKGAVVVAAAGNSNNPSKTYPAYYSNCIAVAATDNNDAKASFSSYGDWVDVAAPGVNVYSTFPNHTYAIGKSLGYDYGNGTSMSTPHVAGIAALVWATDLGTSNEAVRTQIETTAEPIAGTGRYWIWGRVNACDAVGGSCSGEPSPEPPPDDPTPEPPPEEDDSACFRGVPDGKCHPVKDLPGCPDCL